MLNLRLVNRSTMKSSESCDSLLRKYESSTKDYFDRAPTVGEPHSAERSFSNALSRIFCGVRNAPTFQSCPQQHASDEEMCAIYVNRIELYFNEQFGCRPENYVSGMCHRWSLIPLQVFRHQALGWFPAALRNEPALACRLLRCLLTPPIVDDYDHELMFRYLGNTIVPAIAQMLSKSNEISDSAMRDIIECTAIMEKVLPRAEYHREINMLRYTLFKQRTDAEIEGRRYATRATRES